ncbi:recombinase family protein [Pseudomonas sp. SD17-1]|jgi:DNA invertase Pin-like site-specific DNA recombinase|uniref:recombinase family protein n=1 Tax=Pseudomonas sp. SD17-1 TaxID=2976883 RepID=UPI0023DC1FF2|nr:recombinase family protein [Pseudomonas sp. SD17-1]WEJ22301.1 recombinase family protein [Pseudomonas sp. SD17-1]
MFIRAYLRASTDSQDASRAKGALVEFASNHGHKIAAFYTENESGSKLDRPELFRLLEDSHKGDVLLIEGVDRLSRLSQSDWEKLKKRIANKNVTVVSLDLSTSHAVLKPEKNMDDFTKGMIAAVNGMLLDMLAVVARKDYEDRRRRQAQGIEKGKANGVYKGRQVDQELHARIKACLASGNSLRKTATIVGCALSTVQRAMKS